MSVEMMITRLSSHYARARITDEEALQIATALKVGKAMTQLLEKCINQYNPPRISYEETLRLLVAWDKATKDNS